MRSRITGALTLPPSLPCRSSPRRHIGRVGSRLSWITARHLPGREPGLPPALRRAILVDERAKPHPDRASAHIRCVCAARFPPLSACPQQSRAEAAYAFNAAIVPTPVERERSTLGSCWKLAYP